MGKSLIRKVINSVFFCYITYFLAILQGGSDKTPYLCRVKWCAEGAAILVRRNKLL